MCQKRVQVFTCGCKRDAFKICASSRRKNGPGECHMLSHEKDEVMSVQCMGCLVEENELVIQSPQSFQVAEQARAQPRALGAQFLRKRDRKGKGIDRREHPNYPITRKEEEEEEKYDETLWPSQPPSPIQEDGETTWPIRASSSIYGDDEAPWPIRATSSIYGDDEAPWPSRRSSSIYGDDEGLVNTSACQQLLENPTPTPSRRAPRFKKLLRRISDKVKGVMNLNLNLNLVFAR